MSHGSLMISPAQPYFFLFLALVLFPSGTSVLLTLSPHLLLRDCKLQQFKRRKHFPKFKVVYQSKMLNEIFIKDHKAINITVKMSCEISTWVLKTNWIIHLHWGYQRIGLLEIFEKKDFRQNVSRDYCVLNILPQKKLWWLLLISSLWKGFNRVTCSIWNVFPGT